MRTSPPSLPSIVTRVVLYHLEMLGSKSALEIERRHNRLVTQDQISLSNKPNELLGDHLRLLFRRAIHAHRIGVCPGYANAVVPRTRFDLGCCFHTYAHPSEYCTFDYTCPARVMEVRNESQSFFSLGNTRTSPQPFRQGYYLLHWPIS